MAPKCLDTTTSPSHLGRGHQTPRPGWWVPASEGLSPVLFLQERKQGRDAPGCSFRFDPVKPVCTIKY